MIIGIPKEIFPNEKRVALIPQVLPSLKKLGLDICIESGTGLQSGYADSDYEEKGATILETRQQVFERSSCIVQVHGVGSNLNDLEQELSYFRSNQILIAFLNPLGEPHVMQKLAMKNVSAFAMELIPRITRAQSMDALSSMANIVGYKAVLLAANLLPKLFPMMMTAAGTIPPAKVLVLGAGVAGLQAIATAKRLGAIVYAYDIRPEVKEQIMSVGGKFVDLSLSIDNIGDSSGYAKTQSSDFYKKQQIALTKYISMADVVITTAAVPGKKAPLLITKDMMKDMRKGSVVVDLAAETGGNCELTQMGQTILHQGVSIVGEINIASTLAVDASQLYSRNILTLIEHIKQDDKFVIDIDEEIIKNTLVCHNQKIINTRILELLDTKTG